MIAHSQGYDYLGYAQDFVVPHLAEAGQYTVIEILIEHYLAICFMNYLIMNY